MRLKRLDRLTGPILSLAVATPLLLLSVFLAGVFLDGYSRLTPQFLEGYPSSNPERAGIRPALAGSIWVVGLSMLIAIPLGIATSIYLVDFLENPRLKRALYFVVETLAGVPSVIYGIVGLGVLGYTLGLGRTVVTGAVTLAFLILPIIIVASTESLRSVPDSLRMAAYSLGASRLQTVFRVVLPQALPGALTGSILAVARALGEAAPLLVVSGILFTRSPPSSLLDPFTVLPLQIFNWISRPQHAFRELAAAGILVLMGVFLLLNILAIYVRDKYTHRLMEV